MQYLVTGSEMKLFDQSTTAHFRVPQPVLIEQAAMVFVRKLAMLEEEQNRQWRRALILCGSGNNGADGLAIARLLTQQGRAAAVFACGEAAGTKSTAAYRTQKEICEAYKIPLLRETASMEAYDLIIDAVFGIGLSRKIEGLLADVIHRANSAKAWKVTVDVSSGLSADSGAVLGCAFSADDSITFSFGKLGQFLWPGNEYSGHVHIVPMGITKESFLGRLPRVAAIEPDDLWLPVRKAHSNKGTYGKLLVIAGAVNMAGAASLCAHAAYRSGCGLVRVLTDVDNRTILQTLVPEAVLSTYSKNFDVALMVEMVEWADAVVIGPGMGTSRTAREILSAVLDCARVPVVIDADALNILAEEPEQLSAHHGQGFIVTPHLKEMARLTGKSVTSLQINLCTAAEKFANTYGMICVLKDFRTVTAIPEGRLYLNLSGNAGMATAGSGDVLAGVIGSLLAQGLEPELAAPYGVYLHGLAGDAAAEEFGMRALMAQDIIEGLGYIEY